MKGIGRFKGIRVIGVPTNSSGTTAGVARGPAALRENGLIEKLSAIQSTEDAGDVGFSAAEPVRDRRSGIISPDSLRSMILATEAAVAECWAAGRFPLVIGGDCPLLLGCMSAARKHWGGNGLLFLDGHEDAYPPHESLSGEAADMELGFALGLNAPDVDLGMDLPLVSPENAVILGARDLPILKREGVVSIEDKVKVVADSEIHAGNAAEISRLALERIRRRASRWWLHLDLDILSSEALPAVDYRQPGGLDWGTLRELTREAIRTDGILGWNITIYNPDLDPDGEYARRIVEFIAEVVSGGGN